VLDHRFGVFFLARGAAPNPLDIRFRRVSGLGATVTTTAVDEGGQNLFSHTLPDRVTHANLTLERGVVKGSPFDDQLSAALSFFQFHPSNVLVTVFDATGRPLDAWMFRQAFPVSWSFGDLDAGSREVLVEHVELAYSWMARVAV
jgi:phage tail-like protein